MPKPLALTSALLFALALTRPAQAQIDIGWQLSIQQDGREAGQILVPEKQDRCHYVEYWFLYEGFEFVSLRSGASFEVATQDRAGDLDAFLDGLWRAHPEGRLIISDSTETREGCP